jgi:hypothetical protein
MSVLSFIGKAWIVWIIVISVIAITLAGVFGGGMGVAITIPSILGAVFTAAVVYYLFVSANSPLKALVRWISSKL